MKCPYLELQIVSSLEKVFPDERPAFWNPSEAVIVLSGERFSFQAALFWEAARHMECTVEIESDIEDIEWRGISRA